MSSQLFVMANGDNVGEKLGQSVMSNDHEGLSKLSGQIKQAHQMLDKWVEENGGQVIMSSGDESLYSIAAELRDQLDQIRQQYAQLSGHTLTIGVGASISEAAKAMVYGKLNNKDQVVDYDPSMDESMSEGQEAVGDEEPEVEGKPEPKQEVKPEAEEDGSQEQSIEAAGQAQADEKAKSDEDIKADGKDDSKQIIPEKNDEKPVEDKTLDVEAKAPEAAPTQKQTENQDVEPKDILQDPKIQDKEVADKKLITDKDPLIQSNKDDKAVGGDEKDLNQDFARDAKDSKKEEDVAPTDVNPDGSKEVEDEAVEELMPEDLKGDSESQPQSIEEPSMEEGEPEAEAQKEESPEEDEEKYNKIKGMIHGDMASDDQAPAEGEEAPVDDTQDSGELKQKIAQALAAFKENQPLIEDAKVNNPEFYQATMAMLQSMIEMAKQLNLSPEQDAAKDQAVESIPPAASSDEEEKKKF